MLSVICPLVNVAAKLYIGLVCSVVLQGDILLES